MIIKRDGHDFRNRSKSSGSKENTVPLLLAAPLSI